MSQTLKFRICGWGVLLGSVALLILTGVTNWFQGGHQGVTVAGKIINSVGSVSIDVMGLLFCGLAAGVCFGTRRWGWAFVFTIALVASAGWSANSVYSFQATEAISASMTRANANERIKDADNLAKESVSKMTTFAGKTKSSTAREDFIYGANEAIKSFRDAEVKVIVAPDTGAATLAAKLGWDVETVQQLRSAYFAILIIFLKMIGFPGAGFLLSWSPEPTDRRLSSSSKGGGGNGGESVKVPEPPREKKAEIVPLRKAEAPVAPSPTKKPITVSEYLAQHVGVIHTSQAAISAGTGLSPATVSRELKKLEGRGKVKRSQHKRAKAVTYGGARAFG